MSSLFIVLLSFSKSLATKFLFLNEPCMIRETIIDMNPNELRYYPFMISFNKCTGSCNVLSPKICVPKEIKDINVTVFNMITSKDGAKATGHISCDSKCTLDITTCTSQQKCNNKTCQCECKNYHHKCENDYSLNPNTGIFENSKYLKIVIDISVTSVIRLSLL